MTQRISVLFLAAFVVIGLSACSVKPSEGDVQTAIAQTDAAEKKVENAVNATLTAVGDGCAQATPQPGTAAIPPTAAMGMPTVANDTPNSGEKTPTRTLADNNPTSPGRVTAVSISLGEREQNKCEFTQYYSYSITTDGPALVKYLEFSESPGSSGSTAMTMTFDSAGTQSVNTKITRGSCGTVILRITTQQPNEKSAEVSFMVIYIKPK